MAFSGSKVRDAGSLFSWSSIGRGIHNVSTMGQRIGVATGQIKSQYGAYKAIQEQRGYSTFISSLNASIGKLGGDIGRQFDSAITSALKDISSHGGRGIDATRLETIFSSLQTTLGQVAASGSKMENSFISEFTKALESTRKGIQSGGFGGATVGAQQAQRATSGLGMSGAVTKNIKDIGDALHLTAISIKDTELYKAVSSVRDEFNTVAKSAKSVSEVIKAEQTARKKLQGIQGGARGRDASLIEGVVSKLGLSAGELKKADIASRFKGIGGAALAKGLGIFTSLGAVARMIHPVAMGISAVVQGASKVNSFFNNIARTQTKISTERGAAGRQIRGAGIVFPSIMTALGAGRLAGMEDSQVISQMVGLQTQLAHARWGEGALIDNLGKWGLSPFDANGNIKSSEQVMVDISNKLNSIVSPLEKLQFLSMQGFRPEQMEYVAHYAQESENWKRIKKNTSLQGVLENARIVDESGRAAKIAAATEIEYKRRDIKNQNAWDDGILKGMWRSIHPDNWYFADTYARQRGIEKANSDESLKKLQDALASLTSELKRTNKEIGTTSLTSAMMGLSNDDLRNLSLSGGWANASIRNLGDKSIASKLGRDLLRKGEREADLEKLPGYGLLMRIPGIGPALAKAHPRKSGVLSMSNKDIDEGRKLAQGNNNTAWEAWKKKHRIEGISRKNVAEGFDASAAQGAKIAQIEAEASALAGGKPVYFDRANDHIFEVLTKNIDTSTEEGQKAYREQLVKAVARTADPNAKLKGKDAYEYLTKAYDRGATDKEIDAEHKRLLDSEEYKNMTTDQVKEIARQNVNKKLMQNIDPETYQEAVKGAEEAEGEKAGEKIKALKEKMFGSQDVPYQYQTAEEKLKTFREFHKNNKTSLAESITQFAYEHGVSKDSIRDMLADESGGADTVAELKEFQKSPRYQRMQREKKKKEREEKKKAEYDQLISGASIEQINNALVDEGDASHFNRIREKKLRGENLTEKEQAFYDDNLKKVGRKLLSNKKKAEREAKRRKALEPTEEEKAAEARLFKGTENIEQERQAEIAATKERAKEALALMESTEDGTKQATTTMASKSQAAETAAASGTKAMGSSGLQGGGKSGPQNIQVTQNITVQIDGEFPVDEEGIKNGVAKATSDIAKYISDIFVNGTQMSGRT